MNLLDGLSAASSLSNLWPAIAGALVGTAVGTLPGMAPTAAIGMLLPIIGFMHTLPALVFLAAVYYGTVYGSSVSAILLNVPSEPPSVVIAEGGYRLTKQGRGGAAITVAAFSSAIGGITGLLVLALVAPLVANFSIRFGPAEFFAISIFGLVALSRLASNSLGLAIAGVGLGLAFGTIGIDAITGTPRFTFGILALRQGVAVVPVAVGLFGLAEVMERLYTRKNKESAPAKIIPFRSMFPSHTEWRKAISASGRGSVVGFVFGSLPGPALVLASFASYRLERMLGGGREEKHHLMALVAGPKAADDAAVGATLGPLLALGLPFTPVTAVLFAGFVLKGLQPGPGFIAQQPQLFWGLIGAMIIANLSLLLINIPGVNLWVMLLRLSPPYLYALMIVVMTVGVYALNNSWFDVVVMVICGPLGLLLKRVGIERAVVVLGLILGPLAENGFSQTLLASHGSLVAFIKSPISAIFMSATILSLALPILLRFVRSWRCKML